MSFREKRILRHYTEYGALGITLNTARTESQMSSLGRGEWRGGPGHCGSAQPAPGGGTPDSARGPAVLLAAVLGAPRVPTTDATVICAYDITSKTGFYPLRK